MSSDYPLAPQGVYRSLQGEGVLMGLPTVFVRLAGCTVNCAGCDTDYSVSSHATPERIAQDVSSKLYHPREWVWITGGEPTIHDLQPLLAHLRRLPSRPRIALATAGTKDVQLGLTWSGFDFVSVSPHAIEGWVLRRGDQINLVPGLNGLTLATCSEIADALRGGFAHKYLTPPEGASADLLADCQLWVHRHPGWRLGVQAHKTWRLA